MDKVIEAFNRGYVVSLEGQAYNKSGEKVGWIQYYKSGTPRDYITFKVNKKDVHVPVHRLQAFQKYGYKIFEDGIVVRHFDGKSLNNAWDNILIGTQQDNMMDVPEQIRISRAIHASSFKKKYNDKQIKEFHSISKSYKKTMEEFGITSKGTLNYILKN